MTTFIVTYTCFWWYENKIICYIYFKLPLSNVLWYGNINSCIPNYYNHLLTHLLAWHRRDYELNICVGYINDPYYLKTKGTILSFIHWFYTYSLVWVKIEDICARTLAPDLVNLTTSNNVINVTHRISFICGLSEKD